MSFVLIMLTVAAGAVCLTVGLTLSLRLSGALAGRRLARYLAAVQEHLVAYVVQARDDPPPRPSGRFQRRVMRQRLVGLAPSIKGDARYRLGELFRAYGLVDLARADLDSHDGLTRIRAAEAIAAMGAVEGTPWLRERLRHHDHLFGLACARALADLGTVEALPEVMSALAATGTDAGEVAEILLAFGPLAVDFLRERLRGSPVAERRLAAAALGEIRALAAAHELRAALHDSDDELAARAARALGQVGDGSAGPEIAAVLDAPDRSWFVRVAAARALGALEDPTFAPALVRALGDDAWDVRNAASHALAALSSAGVDAVADALDDVPDAGLAHFTGVLDVDARLEPVIAEAATGDERLDRLVHRAAAAGVRACLEQLAAGGDEYASRVLAPLEVTA